MAINPSEPVDGVCELVRRALVEVGSDPNPEPGAHKVNFADMALAGIEQLRSPLTTLNTIRMIGSAGYSTVADLSGRAEDFPEGRAIVHAEHDEFGFAANANLAAAAEAGVSGLLLPNEYHNSILFAPDRVMNAMAPRILPR